MDGLTGSDTSAAARDQVAALDAGQRARLLERLRAGRAQARERDPLLPVPRHERLPLSFAQERMWFLEHWLPDRPVYHTPIVLRLDGPLDATALARALETVVTRHEVLRTRFGEDPGGPVQLIDPPRPVPVPVVDFSDLPPDEAHQQALTHATELLRAPIDLATGPLLRATLCRLGAEAHLFALCLHHATIDDWSVPILVRELAAAYTAARTGRPLDLPPLPIQYADYAVWQRRQLSGGTLGADLDYWRDQHAGLDDLTLPGDYPRPAKLTGAGQIALRHLPPALHAEAAALARRRRAPLLAVLLTAYTALLARYTGRQDIPVGSVFTGRERPEVKDLLGFFANTVVIRADAGHDLTLSEFLDRVTRTVLTAHEHQQVPFDLLVRHLGIERSGNRNPLFQLALVTGESQTGGFELGGLRITPLPLALGISRFDLLLGAVPEPDGGLQLSAEYSTELFTAQRIATLLQHFEEVLAAVVRDGDLRLNALPVTAPPAGPAAAGPAPPDTAAPATTAEFVDDELAELWCELLDVDEVRPGDNFFTAGGTSLQAVALITRVREAYGVAVDLPAFFAAPTAGRLQALIEAEQVAALPEDVAAELLRDLEQLSDEAARDLLARDPTRPALASDPGPAVAATGLGTDRGVLVELSPGAAPGLFLVHPSGGSIAEYGPLTRYLPAGRACWGIEAVGLDGSPPLPDVPSMVEHYVAALRRAQPVGPYHLAGWSSGGVLAFALATALRRDGARVGVVALLDSSPPPRLPAPPDDAELLALFAANYTKQVGDAPVALSPELLCALPAAEQRAAVLDRLIRDGTAGDDPTALVRARMDIFVTSLRSGAIWQPPRYDGRLDLLVAGADADPPTDTAVAAAGWADLAGTVRTHPVPGDHFGMMRPSRVAAVAEVLAKLLADADGSA